MKEQPYFLILYLYEKCHIWSIIHYEVAFYTNLRNASVESCAKDLGHFGQGMTINLFNVVRVNCDGHGGIGLCKDVGSHSTICSHYMIFL